MTPSLCTACLLRAAASTAARRRTRWSAGLRVLVSRSGGEPIAHRRLGDPLPQVLWHCQKSPCRWRAKWAADPAVAKGTAPSLPGEAPSSAFRVAGPDGFVSGLPCGTARSSVESVDTRDTRVAIHALRRIAGIVPPAQSTPGPRGLVTLSEVAPGQGPSGDTDRTGDPDHRKPERIGSVLHSET